MFNVINLNCYQPRPVYIKYIYIYIYFYFYLEDIKYIFNNIKRAIFVYVIIYIYIYFKVKYTIVYPFIHMLNIFRAYINTMYMYPCIDIGAYIYII